MTDPALIAFAACAALLAATGIGVWIGCTRSRASTARVISDLETKAQVLANDSQHSEQTLARVEQAFKEQAEALREEAERRASAEERARQTAELEAAIASLKEENDRRLNEQSVVQVKLAKLESEHSLLQEQRATFEGHLEKSRSQLDASREEIVSLRAQLADAQARLASAQELIGKTDALKEQMTHHFQSLANDVLEAKSKRFCEQNQENLGALLNPLRERIAEIQKKVDDTYSNESKERVSLQGEIRRLAELNQRITTEAANLTTALKGSNKAQGTWGEVVLETVLESSGLREGHEYLRQNSITDQDGTRSQPDVVINLPERRHMVIDSKVSLIAYERFAGAETDEERDLSLRAHLVSMRSHAKRLSEKNYQSLYGLQSLDFVLMFVPIEPAFMQAVNGDRALYMDAWKQNVILVSPTTLLATLSTIASIWRREYQNQNAQEIARHCASLYDKFVGFVEDLEDVGKKLSATQRSYDGAKSKLTSGRGNLLKQIDRVRLLGVKPSKQLPDAMLNAALIDEEDEAPSIVQSAN